jgi:hypothetical protein
VIEQLLGADRPLYISRASDEDLLLTALAGSDPHAGGTLWDRSGLLVDLFTAARSDDTAEQIANCAVEEDNLDWYFLFRLGGSDKSKSSFSIERAIADLRHSARGQLALRVLAHNVMGRLKGGWIDKVTERILVPIIEFADDETTKWAAVCHNQKVSEAALRGKLSRTPVCEMADYLQANGLATGWAWREIATKASCEEFDSMMASPERTEETKLLLLRGRPIELRRPRN